MQGNELNGKNIMLREIQLSDCNDDYCSWLQDPMVNQYLETRWEKQDLFKIKSFVKAIKESENSILFAIIHKASNKHIGNIKIGSINFNHKYADVSYFIGDRGSWGMGYATEAVCLVSHYGLYYLELETLLAGVFEGNVASQRVLKKSGYESYGKVDNKFLTINGERDGQICFSIAREVIS